MEQMRQRLKRSEQSEQERCKIGSRLFCAFELLRFFWVSLSLCALSAVRRSIAKPHALRKNMRLLSRRSIRSWKMSTAGSRRSPIERSLRFSQNLCHPEAECRQLKSRRSLRTSSPTPKEEEQEQEEQEEREALVRARQRWRRAGSAVVQRLSGGQPTGGFAVDAEPEPPQPPQPSSLPLSPSRHSERSEDWPSERSSERALAVACDAWRAEKAQMESQSQELDEENTTLRLLLEEESQRTQALLQQVDYLADLLQERSCFFPFFALLLFRTPQKERQTQSGARDMLKSLGLSREPSPDGALAACDAHAKVPELSLAAQLCSSP